MSVFTQTTEHIKVTVQPIYLDHQSVPEDDYYVWAYVVKLENLGQETVQLINRYWMVTDGAGQVQEVVGEGVVGEQPKLKPGETYQYTSGTSLVTPTGMMSGSYGMTTDNGRDFAVEIPAFSLDSPEQVARPN
jgi:ApaG protein